MTTELDFVSIGSVENVVAPSWSGWAYPARRSLLPLLENAVASTGNVVIQDGPLTLRQAKLTVVAENLADAEIIRGYEETGESVVFTDSDGATCSVMVYSHDPTQMPGDRWSVTVTLIQLTEPVPLGS